MSVYAGPEFNESGLVYYHDMNNRKSYAGAPTTNHVPNADTMPGWTTYGGTPVAFQTEFGTTGYRMTNAPSWNGIYRGITIPSTGVYTFSVWARYLGGSPNNNGGGVYISGWGGSDSASVTNRTQIGQWQRLTITLNCTTTSMTFYLISYGGTNDGNSDRSSWEVTMPQAEAGSVATTFVAGTRSNTQVLRDLTSRNVITANSLTYNANNTFSFNGSTDFLSIPNTQLGNGNIPWTVSCWMRTTTTTNDLGHGSILSNISSGPVYSAMGVNSGRIVYWTYQNSAWSQKLGVRTVNDNNWHMLTWVNYANSTMDMYVDGVIDANVANSTSGNNNPVDVIGRSWAAYFPGSIPVLKRYDRALSSAEIFSNFTASRLRYGI